MSIQNIKAKIIGTTPLLQSNPQCVDRFNPFTKEIARINAKKTRRTDEDYRQLADLEIRSKVHWDEEDKQVFVPSSWVLAAICKNSFTLAKLSKDKIRGSVFATDNKLPLAYRDMNKVKELDDIVGNQVFRHPMNLKQGQVRILKYIPIFHEWSFDVELEFEDTQMDGDDLKRIIEYSAAYGGFGDFRPTFGRARAEVTHG